MAAGTQQASDESSLYELFRQPGPDAQNILLANTAPADMRLHEFVARPQTTEAMAAGGVMRAPNAWCRIGVCPKRRAQCAIPLGAANR